MQVPLSRAEDFAGSIVEKRQPNLIVSSKTFTADFQPPDYLIDGILQRRYLYSLTAKTGSGKTAIALAIAAHVAEGRPLGRLRIGQGRVLYFAGENPDDLRARWIGMSEVMKFDRDKSNVSFIAGVIPIEERMEIIEAEVRELGDLALVIVDTMAAYFRGEDENKNTEAGEHARMLRKLTTLRGGPTVLVLAHPTKDAKRDRLLPRGGGAFVAEVDGNLTARISAGGLIELHWQEKFRGPGFEPLFFKLQELQSELLKDTWGRKLRTVMAEVVELKPASSVGPNEETRFLCLMKSSPGLSLSEIAKRLTWKDKNGAPHKKRSQTAMLTAAKKGLVYKNEDLDRYFLTPEGANRAERACALTAESKERERL